MRKILVVDNYDSFTYNLVYLIKTLTEDYIEVIRNNYLTLENVKSYDKIVISPGPGTPNQVNILQPLIHRYARTKSLFGVCLGQQAIAEAFGGKLLKTKQVFHGISSKIKILDQHEKIFKNLPNTIEVGRYHSWIVSKDEFPKELIITAEGPQKEIMALRHKYYDVVGVQFHPESILTPRGRDIMSNWLTI